jgi:hypothetical protein
MRSEGTDRGKRRRSETTVPRSSLLFLPAAFGLVLAGCGAADDDGGGGSGGPSVEIQQPADGDSLSVPFTMTVESSEELGTTDEGLHHVHVYFDGNDQSYEVIETPAGEEIEIDADSPALEGVDTGEHTLQVSLRNADHSAAGAEDEISVMIGEDGGSTGSGSAGGTSDDGTSDDGTSDDGPVYDY